MTSKPANPGRDQAGRFAKGVSGNVAGKRPGTRHRTTLAVEALLDGQAEALTQKAVQRALEGDGMALRLCLDRIAPARKDRPTPFPLPKFETAADALFAMKSIVAAVADGVLTAGEAGAIAALIESYIKVAEAQDLAARVEALERKGGQ